jgi:endodeoxyribonuclease rusA
VLKFFTPIAVVPRTTAQQKKFSTKTKKFYSTGNLKNSKAKLQRALSGFQPKERYETGIRLKVIWIFEPTQKSKDGERKATRPDLDNLQKLLQDVMCDMKFYKDDGLITDLEVSKRWHKNSGLYIEIEEVEKIDNEFNELMESLTNGKKEKQEK